MQASEHWKCSPLDEVATCYMILDNKIARTILDCCATWNPTFALVLTTVHGVENKPLVSTFVLRSQELFIGRSARPRRMVPKQTPSEAQYCLRKERISLAQLNVQRTFEFLSSSLLPSFNNPVSQAVFRSLRSNLCGLKDFCEV